MAGDPITAVWIEHGCIACGHCPEDAPDVFVLGDWTAQVRGDARDDDVSDENPARSPLRRELLGRHDEAIAAAAAACPVDVIRFRRGTG